MKEFSSLLGENNGLKKRLNCTGCGFRGFSFWWKILKQTKSVKEASAAGRMNCEAKPKSNILNIGVI